MKRQSPDAVTCQLDVRLVVPGDAGVPLSVTLRYDPVDPYAVHATFRAPDGAVEWVFARELLADGLERPVGDGDVRVWPAWRAGSDVVCIALVSPDGHALLEAPAWALEDFVSRMHAVVPAGGEGRHLDLDAAVAALLR
jgi:hypothetical protein